MAFVGEVSDKLVLYLRSAEAWTPLKEFTEPGEVTRIVFEAFDACKRGLKRNAAKEIVWTDTLSTCTKCFVSFALVLAVQSHMIPKAAVQQADRESVAAAEALRAKIYAKRTIADCTTEEEAETLKIAKDKSARKAAKVRQLNYLNLLEMILMTPDDGLSFGDRENIRRFVKTLELLRTAITEYKRVVFNSNEIVPLRCFNCKAFDKSGVFDHDFEEDPEDEEYRCCNCNALLETVYL